MRHTAVDRGVSCARSQVGSASMGKCLAGCATRSLGPCSWPTLGRSTSRRSTLSLISCVMNRLGAGRRTSRPCTEASMQDCSPCCGTQGRRRTPITAGAASCAGKTTMPRPADRCPIRRRRHPGRRRGALERLPLVHQQVTDCCSARGWRGATYHTSRQAFWHPDPSERIRRATHLAGAFKQASHLLRSSGVDSGRVT